MMVPGIMESPLPGESHGWGRLGEVLWISEKAVLVQYHRRTLWIAKANCVEYAGHIYANTNRPNF